MILIIQKKQLCYLFIMISKFSKNGVMSVIFFAWKRYVINVIIV